MSTVLYVDNPLITRWFQTVVEICFNVSLTDFANIFGKWVKFQERLWLQAVFNETEEFILSIDERNNEVVIWDALTAEKVAKWPSNHIGAPRWVEHSPFEAAFITCGNDRSVRFWKEIP